jgi:hypothetical protein
VQDDVDAYIAALPTKAMHKIGWHCGHYKQAWDIVSSSEEPIIDGRMGCSQFETVCQGMTRLISENLDRCIGAFQPILTTTPIFSFCSGSQQ